jgi:short-subunit dehydrogenase
MAKSILITGASSGIGQALAHELAGRGYSLGLAARRLESLEIIRNDILGRFPSIKLAIRHLDVTDYQSVPACIDEMAGALNGLDIVLANAGIGKGEGIGRGQFENAKITIETNLLGAIATVDAAVAYFLKRGGGHVIGTSSVAAFRGLPNSSSYCASKAGFATYLEALRAEVHGKNIDVTILYPGFIDTPLNDMIPNRPFLISAEKGAAIIAGLIGKKAKSSTVPKWPWCIVGGLLKILPTGIVAKM